MHRINTFLFALCISLLILVAGLFHALKQHFPYAPQINAEQESNTALKGQDQANKTEPKSVSAYRKDGRENAGQADEEGSEFWPSFFGLKLKITDSLIALFNLGLFVFTGLLWNSTEKLFKAGERQLRTIRRTALIQSRDMKDSIAAAREANELARETFRAERRPWIALDNVTIFAPIEFDAGSMRLPLEFSIRNTGAEPAMNVSPAVEIVVSGDHHFVLRTKQIQFLANEMQRVTEPVALGSTVFPGQSPKLRFIFNMPRNVIDAAVETDFMNQCRLEHGVGMPPTISLTVLGGIIYRSPGATQPHQTGFAYEVHGTGGDGFGLSGNLLQVVDSPIPAPTVALVPLIIGGFFVAT